MSQLDSLRRFACFRPCASHTPGHRARLLEALMLAGLLVLLGACAADEPAPPPPEPEPVVVENVALGVVIVDLPEVFVVAENQGETLRLVPNADALGEEAAASAAEGALDVHVRRPEVGGVNLVAAWQQHKAEIEARAQGEYKGQNELVTQLGPAFYSRGRYVDEGGAATEETKIFTLHPTGDAMLELVYSYPAGDDSPTRLQDQLFVVLGAIEGPPPEAGSPEVDVAGEGDGA
ncbi:MAG: hypothetical protein AAGC60_01975 [Acidobacteriota bacterium]